MALIDEELKDINLSELLPTQATFYVPKTGFVFYDICALFGVLHLFYTSGNKSVTDRYTHWEIRGVPTPNLDMVSLPSGVLLRSRLPKTGEAIKIFSHLLDGKGEISDYFTNPLSKKIETKEEPRGILEPALQSGARGFQATRYSVLMSSGNNKAESRPMPEVLAATVGLGYAAFARTKKGERSEVICLLPIVKGDLPPLAPLSAFQTLYNFDFEHEGGSNTAKTWVILVILENLARKLEILDFVYAHHFLNSGQPFINHSGLLGVRHLCKLFSSFENLDLTGQSLKFLENARRINDQVEVKNLILELARALADFLLNPIIDSLETIGRIKARLVVHTQKEETKLYPPLRQSILELIGTKKSLKEVAIIMKAEDIELTDGLVEAVGGALSTEEAGAWIGRYSDLERAKDAIHFIELLERILSRARARLESKGLSSDKDKALYNHIHFGLSKVGTSELVTLLNNKQNFRAYKALFLLRVLGSLNFRRGESK